ncbi:MAG: hypothetical protein IJE10_04465 [Clostridia bacterium]|nr:hypothetical protein [Clostridia bacterium]
MKKVLGLTLAVTVAISSMGVSALANEADVMPIAEEEIMLISEEPSYIAQTTTLSGTLSVSDEEILLTDANGIEYVLNVDENTSAFIGNANGAFAEMKADLNGKEVTAVTSTQMTMSIPAQTFAFSILSADETANPIYVEVSDVEKTEDSIVINSADGMYKLAIDPMTDITPLRTRQIVKAMDVKAGDRLVVYSSMMTMSIPALLNPEAIVMIGSAEVAVEEEVNAVDFLVEKGLLKGTENGLELDRISTNAEALTMAYRVLGKEVPVSTEGHWADALITDAIANGVIVTGQTTQTLTGTLSVANGETLLTAEDGAVYQLITDANTAGFIGMASAQFEEAIKDFEGETVTAVTSTAMTRSIPAQVYTYAVLKADKVSNPIYMEIASVEKADGVIKVADAAGNYVAVMGEDADVRPLKSRNIIKAQDLKMGDKIVVYSDMMTMSIPAQLNPSLVIVMEQAEGFVADGAIETNEFIDLLIQLNPEADLSAFVADGHLTRQAMAEICYALLK